MAATAPDGYRTLARLRAAALKADTGDLAGAAALYDQVAADSSADPLLRDLASLLWAQHQLDTGDPAPLEARLKALAVPDNPWHALASENLALLDLRQGHTDAAKATLRGLASDVTLAAGRARTGQRPAEPAGWMNRMTIGRDAAARGLVLTRRAALLAPLGALTGCGLWDNWFGTKKMPLPGKRETIAAAQGSLTVDEGAPKIVLPPPVRNAAWPQAGGNPSHLMGHLAAGDRLAEAWTRQYRRRRRLSPQDPGPAGRRPTASSTRWTSDAVVSAFQLATGARLWRIDTTTEKDRSTNVGGGLAVDQGTLYAVNGLAELVALDAAKGSVRWRNGARRAGAIRRPPSPRAALRHHHR